MALECALISGTLTLSSNSIIPANLTTATDGQGMLIACLMQAMTGVLLRALRNPKWQILESCKLPLDFGDYYENIFFIA